MGDAACGALGIRRSRPHQQYEGDTRMCPLEPSPWAGGEESREGTKPHYKALQSVLQVQFIALIYLLSFNLQRKPEK